MRQNGYLSAQVPVIEAAFQVTPTDLDAAQRILSEERAVFQFNGSMCEIATHRAWAHTIVARQKTLLKTVDNAEHQQ